MSGRAGARLWRLAACSGLLAAGLAGAGEPTYLKRLEMPVAEDHFGYPRAVFSDPATGELFVCDTRKSRILIFDDEGLFRFEIEGGGIFTAPIDLVVDPDGLMVVLASHERRRALIELDFDGFFRRVVQLTGLPDGRSVGRLESIAISPSGDRLYLLDETNLMLWITDRNGRLRGSVDLAPGMSEKQRIDLILGHVDVYADRVLVTVPIQGRVRVLDLEGNPVGAYGAKGTGPCQLSFPVAAALDVEGNLVIADQQRMQILRWEPQNDQCLGEYYGLGDAPGYLYYPMDIALDTNGRAYVSQGFESRVQVYEGLAPAAEVQQAASQASSPEEELAAVEAAVHAWAEAISELRLDDYISSYSRDFLPWGVGDRQTWIRWRRSQMERIEWIEVESGEIAVEPVGKHSARAVFDLNIRSNILEVRGKRTLVLTSERDGWKIIEERVERYP